MVSYHHVQYQKKLMTKFWENLDGLTDKTDRRLLPSKKVTVYTERAYILRSKNSFETFKTHKYLSQGKPPALPNNINPCPMHNPTKNAYNPGLVFRVLQYLNSDIKIYPTATIILKFWVVLEQTFCKKRHTVNPGIPEHGTAEHPRTVADNGTLAEYPRIPTTFWKSIKVFSVK